MQQALRHTLASLGLNEKEVTLYLTLMAVGSSPASTLATRTGITRSTVQYTCQQLAKKGIIGMTQKNNTFLYVAEKPEKLLYMLEMQQQELEQKKENVHRIMGNLRGLMNPGFDLPKVQFYEGQSGLMELHQHLLNQQASIDAFEDGEDLGDALADYLPTFHEARLQKHLKQRTIRVIKNNVEERAAQKLEERRDIPQKDFPFTGDMKISKDLVAIFSVHEGVSFGMAVRSAPIAQNFRLLFQVMWQSLERTN